MGWGDVVEAATDRWWLIECLSKKSPEVVIKMANSTRYKNRNAFVTEGTGLKIPG